jgi:hypothetical protein
LLEKQRQGNKFIGVQEVKRNENVFSVYRSRKRREVKGTEDGKGRIYTESCRIYQDTETFLKRVCRLREKGWLSRRGRELESGVGKKIEFYRSFLYLEGKHP